MTKQIAFPSFKEALNFVDRVGGISDRLEVYPKVVIEKSQVALILKNDIQDTSLSSRFQDAVDELVGDKKPVVNETSKLPVELKLYCDGGSRGNPGPSAGGFVLLDMNDEVLFESGKYLGVTTNNQAEYHSLKGGLEMAHRSGVRIVHVYMDSLLVINQMKGIFKIRNRDLWPIHQAISELVGQFEHVNFTHVPRELNKLADAVVNRTLDDQM